MCLNPMRRSYLRKLRTACIRSRPYLSRHSRNGARMRILIALGGNALLGRGEPMTIERQIANIRRAAEQIARVARGNQLIVAHGNGPQVGLLALQAAANSTMGTTPLDVLDAESEGMIGYLLEQELANALGDSRHVVTFLTRVEVDSADPAFAHPTKPIGPI